MKNKLSSDEQQNLLLILVGESGAGKSTLCRLIGQPEKWYSSSGAIVDALQEKGVEINHDTIHAFANEAYKNNPEWQIPQIIDFLNSRGCIVLDGPRRLQEVRALEERVPNTKIIKVTAPEEIRFSRLQKRDNIDESDFQRILVDEAFETELGQILNMCDYTIQNNGTMEELSVEAQKIAKTILEYSVENSEERKSEIRNI
jgi:dephospho-CoA kinase